MPFNTATRDERNNIVSITLFESYLAKFTLDNQSHAKVFYQKLLVGIEKYFQDPKSNEALQQFIQNKTKNYSLERHLFNVFSQVSIYPGQDSFKNMINNFHLPAADYLIKLIAEEFLGPLESLQEQKCGFFESKTGRRSPYQASRNPSLFNEINRGVVPVSENKDGEDEAEFSTCAIGIVSEKYRTHDLDGYFAKPIYPAGLNYWPNEDSFVAKWLRDKHCPVIAGSSGSTEMLISRVFPIIPQLTKEEKQTIVFAQACNMVAHGHHSFFESMLVADTVVFNLSPQKTLKEHYLQCIPNWIKDSQLFQNFLLSEPIASLPLEEPIAINSALSCNQRKFL